jgi:hypothetical protein
MHIDKWVKASVVVAIIMGVPGWIGVFRPSSFSNQKQDASIAGNDTGATCHEHDIATGVVRASTPSAHDADRSSLILRNEATSTDFACFTASQPILYPKETLELFY